MNVRLDHRVACKSVIRLSILVSFFLITLLPGTITSNAADSDVKISLSSQDYLSAARRLTIRFRGYPGLTGDYRIGPDQTVSIPVLGRISVEGQNAAQLERTLARKANEIGGKIVYVTVEIASYKTLFVMGSVVRSGAIEWQPGVTVLQAVALAGGFAPEFPALVTTSPGGPTVNPLTVAKSVDTLKRDLARFARLLAERDGKKQVGMPGKLIELAGPTQAKRLIDVEEKMMLFGRSTRVRKLDVLTRGIAAEKGQISSLRDQLDRIGDQLVTRQKQLKIVAHLRVRGIVAQNRLFEQEIKVSDLEEKIAGINAGIAGSIAALAALELQKVSVERSHRESLLEAISKIEEQMSKTGIDLGKVMKTSSIKIETGEKSQERKSRYKIVRGSGSKPVFVSSQTNLKPGDVLLVTKR